MNIFRLFESEKFMKYAPKRTKLHHSKKFIRGRMPPKPPSKRLLRHTSQVPKKVGPLGKSCIRPWTTTEKFT